MDARIEDEDLDELELLTRPGREDELETFLLLLHPADVAELLHDCDQKTALAILKHLSTDRAAILLSELPPEEQEAVIAANRPEELAQIVEAMETDDIADLIQELDQKTASELMAILPIAERKEVAELLKYDPSSAGGIMQTELVSVRIDNTVSEAMDAVRRSSREVDILSVFVVDDSGRYCGNLALQSLVFAPPDAKIETVMTPKEAEVRVSLHQEEVAKVFDHYSLVEVGVVDDAGVLVGRITADDVHEVLVEEAEEDMLKMVGSGAQPDVIYSDKIVRVAWLRLPWLASNFVSGFIAAAILSSASVVFGTMVVLLTFVPIITGMSGNVGSQSAMIMIRGMAVGAVTDDGLAAYVFRDLIIGLLMALACGIAVTLGVAAWKGNIWLGLCVGASLVISMIMASLLGSVEPAMLKKLGIDPAIAAGPLITSMNDISGVIIYTLVALAFLKWVM